MQELITQVIPVSAQQPDSAVITAAVAVLRSGGLVAFPTETVYGLGADALKANAVRKIFEAKGRPSDNPLIVHLGDPRKMEEYGDEIPDVAYRLAERFWPGPLTLVVKRSILVSDEISAGLETVGIRVPNHPVSLALLREFGEGIVAPSANVSGRPSPTDACAVEQDLSGKIELILDAGPTEIGVESTVLDVTQATPVILRWGGVTREALEAVVGKVEVTPARPQSGWFDDDLKRRSPGTRYRHYAPRATVVLVERENQDQFVKLLQTYRHKGKNVGGIVHSRALADVESGKSLRVLPSALDMMARHLFRTMRELDDEKMDVILIESVAEEGLGITIMDRLRRAAEEPS